MVDVAKVLTLEEQERMREEILAMRNQITGRRKRWSRPRTTKSARDEVVVQEENRRQADDAGTGRQTEADVAGATELRQSDQITEAIEVVDKIIAVEPTDERARRWHDDLIFLEAQERQVIVRADRNNGVVDALTDTEESAIPLAEKVHGEEKYLRYPSAKKWQDLTELRRELLKAVKAEPKGVAETRKRLGEEIDLDFERTSLDNVLKYIGEIQKVNIVISPDIAAEGIDLSSRLVDLKVRRISIESVFGLILGADLGYRVESGYVLITTRAKLQQNLPVVTYPVQDLIAAIPDYGATAPQFNLANIGNNVNVGGAGAPAAPAAVAAAAWAASLRCPRARRRQPTTPPSAPPN